MTRGLRPAVAAAALAIGLGVGGVPAGAAPGPSSSPEYWFDAWHLESLWATGVRGQGVTIAEIDTGVDGALPELAGRVLRGTDLGQPGDGRVDRQRKRFGHGTAMASIMVARRGLFGITGIAPAAKILPIAVPLQGTTDEDVADDLPSAIRYAADHGAKVISMSLGGERNPSADDAPCPPDEQAAIFHAVDRGAVVLASVGNTGPTKNTVEEPGVCLGVVSVGAVNSAGRVASFSGRQPYLTLVAPGVDVPSLGRIRGQAFSGDGTSQATAITSAVLALVWSRYPALSARRVVARLLATLDAHRTTPDRAYGYGELDAYRAVVDTVPATAANPVAALAAPFIARAKVLSPGVGTGAAVVPGAASVLGPAPKQAGLNGPPPPSGTYAVGPARRLRTPQVIVGLVAAAVGVALLLVLVLVGVRARRRRRVGVRLRGEPGAPAAGAQVEPAGRPSPRPRPDG